MKKFLLLLSIVLLVFLSGCKPEKISPDDKGSNEEPQSSFDVFKMDIAVENNASIVSKEDYLRCTITVDGMKIFPNFTGDAKIRGRGNSSWLWYDKKPYRIKLHDATNILGLKSSRDWVLLANYRDPTKLMNTFSFEVADWLGIAYPNHTRYLEVTMNGKYIGLYQLTEQVEQGSNRVNIDPNEGILLCLDADDGPELSPDATDNFWSSIFNLPVAVKYPANPNTTQLSTIRLDFSKLEQAINAYNYQTVDSLLDIPSFINTLILQELVYNVELDAPRSMFLWKDKGGKYVFGPAWDFDAGFDFDWGTMFTGHNYFTAQELVMGTDPASHKNGYSISGFFTQMFRNPLFVAQYKTRWNTVKDSIVSHAWSIMEKYTSRLNGALERDLQRWPINKNYSAETLKMRGWLLDRVNYLNNVINNYPAGNIQTTFQDCGTLNVNVPLSFKLGYAQNSQIKINQDTLLQKLGINLVKLNSNSTIIVPLNTDGTVGENHTNGTYGGWFGKNNNPGYWDTGHVYIEITGDLLNWNCGLRNDSGYCAIGDKHTVTIQYQFTEGSITKTVKINVLFTVSN